MTTKRLKKYIVWQDNGTGYLDSIATVEAANQPAAKEVAAKALATHPSSLIITSPGVDPNAWGASGNAHPNHRKHAKESMRRNRQKRDSTASVFGFSSHTAASTALFEALSGDSQLIELVTPLRCSVGGCEHIATVAHAYPIANSSVPGMWLIQPICVECTVKLDALYAKGDENV